MDQETMNQLLANKDKYKASNKSRETFEKEWLSYVNENGVDETAIKYLFTGFEYRRFHPFTNYIPTSWYCCGEVKKQGNTKQWAKIRCLICNFTDFQVLMILSLFVLASVTENLSVCECRP